MRRSRLLPALALAAAISTPAAAETCSNTSLSASVAGLTALGCAGSFSGNIIGSAAELTQLGQLWSNYSFAYLGKSDDSGSGPFTANPREVSTNLGLSFDQALTGVFVIGLKATDKYSFFMFDAASPVWQVTFNSTVGVAANANGRPNALSHAALYRGTAVGPSAPPPSPLTPVPEPETYAMILAGLGLMGARLRRRKPD